MAIDWTKPADYIERFVRAMQPWPTAYTFLHRPGKEPMRVIVNKVVQRDRGALLEDGDLPVAGRLLFDTNEAWASWGKMTMPSHTAAKQLLVICGELTSLEILEVKPAGKPPMTATEFLRGNPMRVDMRFGPEVLS